MMRSLSSLPVSLLFLSWSILALADSDTTRLDCAHKNGKDASCNEPIDAVTPITPGYYYIAKVPCLDCPIVVNEGDVPGQKHYITEAENELVRRSPSLSAPLRPCTPGYKLTNAIVLQYNPLPRQHHPPPEPKTNLSLTHRVPIRRAAAYLCSTDSTQLLARQPR